MACSHPIILKDGRICNCGKCYSCRQKLVNDWAVRMDLENRFFEGKSVFVTLTYNNENLPEDALLCPRDLDLFLKRLRRRLEYHFEHIKIKYFACGEYGDKLTDNLRPHYHLIIFGLKFSSQTIDIINDCWSKGFIKVLPVNFRNLRYVAKYCVKSFCREKVSKDGEVFKEFVRMSKGLGFACLDKLDFYGNISKDTGFLKLNGYSYCIPYALKRKAKAIGLQLPLPPKKWFVIYNNFKFKHEDDFKIYYRFADFAFNNGIDIYDNVTFIKVTDYLKKLSEINGKEKLKAQIFGFDLQRFYRSIKYDTTLLFSGMKFMDYYVDKYLENLFDTHLSFKDAGFFSYKSIGVVNSQYVEFAKFLTDFDFYFY